MYLGERVESCEPSWTTRLPTVRNYFCRNIFNVCLGAGSRQYCQYTKPPLGITPLKEIWESPRVKEDLTSVGFEPTTSG